MARNLGYLLNDLGIIENDKIDSLKDNENLEKIFQAPARMASSRGAEDRFHAFAQNRGDVEK